MQAGSIARVAGAQGDNAAGPLSSHQANRRGAFPPSSRCALIAACDAPQTRLARRYSAMSGFLRMMHAAKAS
jgi:hypothetical protein